MAAQEKGEGSDLSLEALADQNTVLYRYNPKTKRVEPPPTPKRTEAKARALSWFASLKK